MNQSFLISLMGYLCLYLSFTASGYSTSNPISINTSYTSPSTCTSGDGTISAFATGGTPPYTYTWSNGRSGSFIFGLNWGQYIVSVSDAGGCTAEDTVLITLSNLLVSTSTTPATCPNSADGAVSISVSGGNAPYSFLWSNGATTQSLSGILPGTYSVIITESDGCGTVANVVVGPPAFQPNEVITASTVCEPPYNGSIQLSPSGGTAPLTYAWSTGGTGNTLTGLAPGTYSVTLTDADNCTYPLSFVVPDEAMDPVAFTTPQDVLCNGDSSGSVVVTVISGSGQYDFQWNTGDTVQSLFFLPPGMYTCTITDLNSRCTTAVSASLIEPSVLTGTLGSTPDSTMNRVGTATVTVQGGVAPYQYSWNTSPAQVTPTATGLAPGTYVVTVTDWNGCEYIDSVEVDGMVSVDPLEAAGVTRWDVLPNPSDGTLYLNVSLNKPEQLAVEVLDLTGSRIFHQSWESIDQLALQLNLSSLPAGVYLIRLRTNLGQVSRKWMIGR